MATHTHPMEQFEDDEELEFQAKVEEKFQKFCAKISAKNYEDPFMDDEPILLDEFDHIDIHIEICNNHQFVSEKENDKEEVEKNKRQIGEDER